MSHNPASQEEDNCKISLTNPKCRGLHREIPMSFDMKEKAAYTWTQTSVQTKTEVISVTSKIRKSTGPMKITAFS